VVVYVSSPVPDPPDTKKVPVVSTPRLAGREAKNRLAWLSNEAAVIVVDAEALTARYISSDVFTTLIVQVPIPTAVRVEPETLQTVLELGVTKTIAPVPVPPVAVN
jgi:hypothetical protein